MKRIVIENCLYCGEKLEKGRTRAKRFCNKNHYALWRYDLLVGYKVEIAQKAIQPLTNTDELFIQSGSSTYTELRDKLLKK